MRVKLTFRGPGGDENSGPPSGPFKSQPGFREKKKKS